MVMARAAADPRIAIAPLRDLVWVFGRLLDQAPEIGAVQRHTDPATGRRKPVVSGYANTSLPKLRDRCAKLRTA
jgi:hypothetical protein